jgi:hypothetical protein
MCSLTELNGMYLIGIIAGLLVGWSGSVLFNQRRKK